MLHNSSETNLGKALLAAGGVDSRLDEDDLGRYVAEIVDGELRPRELRRVLIVPPDHTRLHSAAGPLTIELKRRFEAACCEVGVLPALGTHVEMDEVACVTMFGDALRPGDLLVHDWRNRLRALGVVDASAVSAATDGRYAEPFDVAVDEQLFDDWDLVVSVGQVVPHEVIGMANFTKNLVIGLGGEQVIHRSHFIGALAGIESIMGRTKSPVRDLVDTAFDRFIRPVVPVLWILTVVEDTDDGLAVRGLFVGRGGTTESGGAAFRAAAELARAVNVQIVDAPFERCVCWLDPREFHSTWLGNKAIYRTRMAMADGGELVVLAPGVERFGEDEQIDELIRKHGYRGTQRTLDAVRSGGSLVSNLSAAAHLVHGSSEGRFDIVYCTDPSNGGLPQSDVESVGYRWRHLTAELERLSCQVGGRTGERHDATGQPYMFIANPALGLWSTAPPGV
jgi:nickel-dependent lactate racemase